MPFGKLQAATKDGKAVKNYPSLDTAFTEIVGNIKKAIQQLSASTKAQITVTPTAFTQNPPLSNLNESSPRSSNLTIKRQFTQLQIDRFLIDTFQFITKFFNNSLAELKERNPDVKLDFLFNNVDSYSFEASIYIDGKSVSYAAIFISKSFYQGIFYSSSRLPHGGNLSYNDSLSIQNDGSTLTLKTSGISITRGQQQENLTQEGAAEHFWSIFISPLQR